MPAKRLRQITVAPEADRCNMGFTRWYTRVGERMRNAVRLILLVLFGAALNAAPAALADAPPEFDRDVKPILQRRCFECHGPDKQKGGLRLDQKPSTLKGGDS